MYVAHANGGNPVLIDSESRQPAWASDGKTIAYVKGVGNSNLSIWVSDRSGTNKTEVLRGRSIVTTPIFFPDDQTITFVGEFTARVFSIRIGEAAPTLRIEIVGDSGYLLLSPTRTRPVLAGNSQGPGGYVSILDQAFTQTRIGGTNAFSPVSSPNGAMVAFAYCDRTFTAFPGGPCSIRVGDGTTTTTIYNGPAIENLDWQRGFDWSPDSSSLILSVASGGGPFRLAIVNADGTGLAPLTASGSDDQTDPAWQPENH